MQNFLECYTQALTEGIPDSVWAFDKDYKLVLCNAAFLDMRKSLYGFDLVPGDSFFKGVTEQSIQKWIPIYNEVLNGKRLILDDTRDVKGYFKQVRISLAPVHNKNNEVIGCMGITIDISQVKNLESQIKQLKVGIADITKTLRGPLKQSLERMFSLEDQLAHNLNLEQEEKEEIIRLATNELQLIKNALLELNELEQLL
jgi:hypothetical protein